MSSQKENYLHMKFEFWAEKKRREPEFNAESKASQAVTAGQKRKGHFPETAAKKFNVSCL